MDPITMALMGQKGTPLAPGGPGAGLRPPDQPGATSTPQLPSGVTLNPELLLALQQILQNQQAGSAAPTPPSSGGGPSAVPTGGIMPTSSMGSNTDGVRNGQLQPVARRPLSAMMSA